MARYRVTAPTFLEDVLREEGEVVDYAGDPGSALAPLDAAANRAVKAYRARRTAVVVASLVAEEKSSATASSPAED
jgi:hypothetical protein